MIAVEVLPQDKQKKKKRKQNEGKKFEKDFIDSAPTIGCFTYRLKDDTSGFSGVRNPCDFMLFKQPHLYMLELKSHLGRSIPFGALQLYQVNSLYENSKVSGTVCGFVFNFRDFDMTVFVDAVKVYDFYKAETRKSFPLDWCLEEGIVINQTKKRTRFRYDVEQFLMEAIK